MNETILEQTGEMELEILKIINTLTNGYYYISFSFSFSLNTQLQQYTRILVKRNNDDDNKSIKSYLFILV